jgi:hypothetical protein
MTERHYAHLAQTAAISLATNSARFCATTQWPSKKMENADDEAVRLDATVAWTFTACTP